MPKKISNKTKQKLKMGKGIGKDYKPFITTNEFNSIGTTSVIRDWKTGRGVHCLSQGEAYWYYILRWNDNNIDIREQFPLNKFETQMIANQIGIKHPGNEDYIMTTDFLVTNIDKSLHAYSIKSNRKSLNNRTLEILTIEKLYWLSHNVEFSILFKEDLNLILVHNIRKIIEFYDSDSIFDEISNIKHKIANKKIKIDLSKEPISTEFLNNLMEKEKNEYSISNRNNN